MRFILISAILFLWPAWSASHPLHLSVTNITLENGKLKVIIKTFRDDWEVAYFHYHSQPIDLTLQENRDSPWFEKYLNDHFNLSMTENGGKLGPAMDTVWLEDDAMIIEMQFPVSDHTNSLYIYNAILTDIYPDQTNLVIFGFKNKETGIKFDVKKHSAQVMLN